MKNIVIILWLATFLLISKTGCSQVFIEGKIIDADTKKSIAYASISLEGSTQGTASNELGNFVLKSETTSSATKIKISSIGYTSLILSIDSLERLSGKKILIPLQPQTITLNDVVVKAKSITPEELLSESFKAINQNYAQQPFNMEFYSNVFVRDSIKTHYQVESILLTYRKGYVSGGDNISKIIQKRESGVSPLRPMRIKKKDVDYFPYSPDFNISLIDRIGAGPANGWTVFNPSIFKKLKFRYADISIFDRDTVCAIEYSTKARDVKGSSNGIDGQYNGIIYIAVNNLAIIRHTLKIGSQRHDIIYKKTNGLYFPYLIKSTHVYGQSTNYSIVQEVFLRTIKMDKVEVLQRNSNQLYYEDIPYNKEYWEANYPVQKRVP